MLHREKNCSQKGQNGRISKARRATEGSDQRANTGSGGNRVAYFASLLHIVFVCTQYAYHQEAPGPRPKREALATVESFRSRCRPETPGSNLFVAATSLRIPAAQATAEADRFRDAQLRLLAISTCTCIWIRSWHCVMLL